MNRFAGKVALVTGAASGIGRATAARLAAEGAVVVATDINDHDGLLLQEELRGLGSASSRYLRLDVTDEANWTTVIDSVLDAHGTLDVLVNNAGVGDLHPIEETTKAAYEHVVAILQTAVFLGMRCAGPALKADGGGAVVNVSSMFGIVGGAGLSPAYHGAKGAVRTMSKGLAVNWGADNVRVNSIHPGFIATPMIAGANEAELASALPMARIGHPEEVAAAIAFLASDDASYITGAELAVDGGYVAQ